MRENQRKSRARKQEHIRDLEQRLMISKDESRGKDIQHRLAMQKVEEENRHLRNLLGSLGITENLVQQYLQLADQGPTVHRKVAIPALHRSKERYSPPLSASSDSRLALELPSISNEILFPTKEETPHNDIPPAAIVRSGDFRTSQQSDLMNPRLCACPTRSRELTSFPSEEDVLNSTLCAIAEELISQYNTRGADLEEIKGKLWTGFRAGTTGDGCRVQNQVLFQVLDEISNTI